MSTDRRPDIINGNYALADGQEHKLEVSWPYGAGSWSVKIDNYHCGQIVPSQGIWRPYLNTPLLIADEIDYIVECIRRQYPLPACAHIYAMSMLP